MFSFEAVNKMKTTMRKLIFTTLLLTITFGTAQNKNDLWKKSNLSEISKRITKTDLPQKNIFELDLKTMKKMLGTSPKRENINTTSNLIITLPNGEGKLENFKVYENSIMAPELAAKYPEIKSYMAVGIDNPNARAYFSYSPLGFKSMTLYPDQSAVFIEPVSDDLTTYTVYKKSDKKEEVMKTLYNLLFKKNDAIVIIPIASIIGIGIEVFMVLTGFCKYFQLEYFFFLKMTSPFSEMNRENPLDTYHV